jgi:hypothetical protein
LSQFGGGGSGRGCSRGRGWEAAKHPLMQKTVPNMCWDFSVSNAEVEKLVLDSLMDMNLMAAHIAVRDRVPDPRWLYCL